MGSDYVSESCNRLEIIDLFGPSIQTLTATLTASCNRQESIDLFGLDEVSVRQLHKEFELCDKNHSGSISIEELFAHIGDTPNAVSRHLFAVTDTDGDGYLGFGELVKAVGTVCMFGTEELLRLCFSFFDEDRSGFLASNSNPNPNPNPKALLLLL